MRQQFLDRIETLRQREKFLNLLQSGAAKSGLYTIQKKIGCLMMGLDLLIEGDSEGAAMWLELSQ